MDSCPVCYEAFSVSPHTVARRLPCEHAACTQCLRDCFEADSESRKPEEPEEPGVRCPECFHLFLFDSIEAVPKVDFGEQGVKPGVDVSPEAVAEPEASSTSLPVPETLTAHGGSNGFFSSSKLAAFLKSNRGDSHIPGLENGAASQDLGVEASGDGQSGENRKCKVDGCRNRAVQSVGVCAAHTKRASVVSVSAMVHKFKDTKLSSVALKSDKVEVNRGGVAGAGEAGFDPEAIAHRFRRQERLELGEAVALIEAVKNIFREEQNMVELDAPVMVVGDVHGQYFDLLNILKKWRPDHNLLFLGDYVDRGQFSCEVILQLFALKLRHPTKVFLIRGNHECSAVSAHFGFKDECKAKYGLTVYYRFLLAFQTMPICALIMTTSGRIFACHGGISPGVKRLSDIENIDRFAEPEMEGPLCDMLWADPLNEDDSHKLTDDEYRQFLDTDYIANQVRGCSYMFGYHAVQKFLRENRLMYMVRAHEVQEQGFKSHFQGPPRDLSAAAEAAKQEDFTDEDSEELESEEEDEEYDQVPDTSRHMNPTVLTVFSAPNYCDRYRNKAAILHVEKQGYYTVNLLEAEPHPDPVQETDVNLMQLLAMGNTCPYMPTSFREFLKVAVDLGRAVEPTSTATGIGIDDLQSFRTLSMASVTSVGTGNAGGEQASKSCTPSSLPSADCATPMTPVSSLSPVGGGRDLRGDAVDVSPGSDEQEKKQGDDNDAEEKDDGDDNDDDDTDNDDHRHGQNIRNDEDDEAGGNSGHGCSFGLLPNFASKERRSLSRMISAPIIGEFGKPWSTRGGDRAVSWDGGEKPKLEVHKPRDAELTRRKSSLLAELLRVASQPSATGAPSGPRASSPGLGLLSRQHTWAGGSPKGQTSEHYRRAHARDGINEMHPYVLNRRISHQESEEMQTAAAQAAAFAEVAMSVGNRAPGSSLTFAPSASVSPESTPCPGDAFPDGPSVERAFIVQERVRPITPGAPKGNGIRPFASAPARSEGTEDGGVLLENGEYIEPSPAPPARFVRRQFSLDLSLAPSISEKRVTESKSRHELAAMMYNSSITELAEGEQMDGDFELETEPASADDDGDAPPDTAPKLSPPRDRGEETWRTSPEAIQIWATPSPGSRKGSTGAPPSPSQILFTHEEIVVLKLLFSLFDRKGKNFITRDDIVAYAEEGGDFAQLREVDACMEAVDADGDGKVGLSDYINFAARLKEIHSLQQLQDASDVLDGSPLPCHARLLAPTPE